MLTKDDVQKAQKDQNAEKTAVLKDQMAAAQKTDAQNGDKIDSHNYSLDDVMLGKRVKIARKEKRLTQEELAGLCNCLMGQVLLNFYKRKHLYLQINKKDVN